ncbi:hypothetical protein [Longimicrobium terrae]|uniref:Uncharacterized protein n=1 Tax=Longimicrobium terrae TaxID=1639882 RepID=A0A841H7C8_9BACT|nr:hypothetical protein [Longimicrobium terrae]MBB4639330.1 hypothetical protein [Longimicrobium terrae]MBB6073599.1 hypothetical protein [Longimicrobium terrae]NNC29394.1 hypothetical protein [Longimicrobium terrae]
MEIRTEQAAAGAQGRADRVFGIIGGALMLLALVFLVRSFTGGAQDTGTRTAAAPALRILSPAPGTVADQPLSVELDAGTALTLGPMGWNADGRHLHLFVGGTELMAASTELAPVRGTVYRWTLPRLPAGATTLRLSWSGQDHRTVAEGASQTVPVTLR